MLSRRKWGGPLAAAHCGEGTVVALDPGVVDCSGPWLFWPREPEPGFSECLRHMGQLAPVLVAEAGGGWELVAGYARLKALALLGQEAAACVVEADAATRGLLYLADNQGRCAQGLTPAMRLQALAYLRPLLAPEELKARVAPLLGLDPAAREWRNLMAWLDLPDPPEGRGGSGAWRRCLLEGRLDLECVETLSRLDARELAALLPYFVSLSWSRSAGREFLRELFEASRARRQGLEEMLRGKGLREPFPSEPLALGLSPKDVMQRLLNAARALRRPRLAALNERFNRAVAGLGQGGIWRVEPSPSFEANEVRLVCRVRDREGLARASGALDAMTRSPLWEHLWRVAEEDDGEAS